MHTLTHATRTRSAWGTGISLLGPALLGAALLSGCAATDPYTRMGNWRPNHANDTNLVAMVAVPSDLARGVADDHRGSGQNAATAVYRQRNEQVYQLPDSGVARITPIATGSGGGGNAGSSSGQAGSGGASQ